VTLDANARELLDSSAEVSSGPGIFARYRIDGTTSGSLSRSAAALATLARAWVTPGSGFGGSDRVRDVVVDGIGRLLDAGYHEGATTYDNWWDWEIGTARPLADLMCIMRNELPPGLLEDSAAAIRYFIPDPTYSELLGQTTTASNRVNAVRGALIAAITEEDDARVDACVKALPASWQNVTERDGFYEDGGFIQHLNIAYTGNYGVDLLHNLAPMLSLFDGTERTIQDRELLWDLIDLAYIPIVVNGHVLDSVRGRAVARVSVNGSAAGSTLIGAIAEVARTAPQDRRDQWFTQIATWAEGNPTRDLLQGGDLPAAAALTPILAVPGAASSQPRSSYFPSMDRLVHRASGWTLAVSMCSERVAAFEGTDSENSRGVLTGNMMRYLFVGDDPSPYDDYFWSTLDYSRPPGTTNHRIRFEPLVTRGNNKNVPDNEWAGGLLHGSLSVAAMHQKGPEGKAPECRRLTIATDDRVIELVSDISSHYEAFSTVENRLLPESSSAMLTVNGATIEEPARIASAQWAHLEGVGGYVFLGGAEIDAGVTTRIGSRIRVEEDVDAIPASQEVTRRWATLDLNHGQPANAAAWVVLPGAEASAVSAMAQKLDNDDAAVSVRRNGHGAQAVSLDHTTTVAAAWRSSSFALTDAVTISFSDPVLAVAELAEGVLTLRLTEPTQTRERVDVLVTGTWTLASIEEIEYTDVAVRTAGGKSRVTARTRGRGGAAFTVSLRSG
jgi:hyaluronate lyase